MLVSGNSAAFQAMASADMDPAQLEAFLTAQTRRQGGGLSLEQGAVLARFWKTQRTREIGRAHV